MPKYSAPVAVADVLVVFGTATMNSAAVGNGIGNVAVRDEQYPHCIKHLWQSIEHPCSDHCYPQRQA